MLRPPACVCSGGGGAGQNQRAGYEATSERCRLREDAALTEVKAAVVFKNTCSQSVGEARLAIQYFTVILWLRVSLYRTLRDGKMDCTTSLYFAGTLL